MIKHKSKVKYRKSDKWKQASKMLKFRKKCVLLKVSMSKKGMLRDRDGLTKMYIAIARRKDSVSTLTTFVLGIFKLDINVYDRK